jgi:hypothetical protein
VRASSSCQHQVSSSLVLSTQICTQRASILYFVSRTSPLLFSNVSKLRAALQISLLFKSLHVCRLESQGPCDNGLGRQLAVKYNFRETLDVSFAIA